MFKCCENYWRQIPFIICLFNIIVPVSTFAKFVLTFYLCKVFFDTHCISAAATMPMPIHGVVIHSFLYFNILHGNMLLTLRLFISCLHCTQPCIPLLGWLGSLCFWISFQVVLENTEGMIHRCVEEKVERCRYLLLIFKHGTRYIGHWPNNHNYKTHSPYTWNDFISYFDFDLLIRLFTIVLFMLINLKLYF